MSPLISILFNILLLLLFPLKSSENVWFSDDFRGNRSNFRILKSIEMNGDGDEEDDDDEFFL